MESIHVRHHSDFPVIMKMEVETDKFKLSLENQKMLGIDNVLDVL